jgi:hypothetical protein
MPLGCVISNTTAFTAIFGNQRQIATLPKDNKQTNYTLSADYDLGHASSIEGVLERENYSHTYRERDKTWEDKFKLGYVNRNLLEDATLRASYEHDRKRGSFYDPLYTDARGVVQYYTMYGQTYSRAALQSLIAAATPVANGGLGLGGTGIIPTLAQLQAFIAGGQSGAYNNGGWMKPDQADRDQNIFNGRLNYMVRSDLDVGAMVQFKNARYPANSRGLQKDDLNSYNVDVNYQPISDTQFSFFYSRQDGRQTQVENYGNVPTLANNGFVLRDPLGNIITTLAQYSASQCTGSINGLLTTGNIDCFLNNSRIPGSDVSIDTRSRNHVIGFGMSTDIGAVKLGANFTHSRSVMSIMRANGISALTAANAAVEAQYGGLPDTTMVMNSLDLNLMVPVDKRTSVHLLYRFEGAQIKDWHYDFNASNPGRSYIPADYGPQNYHTNVIGVFLQYKL